MVDYEAGKTILETALGIVNRENINQLDMFPTAIWTPTNVAMILD